MMKRSDRRGFERVMGEEFSEALSPPLPFEEASPYECCEVIWSVLGTGRRSQDAVYGQFLPVLQFAESFGRYFETEAPSIQQIETAIARTLGRWPAKRYCE